MLFIVSFYFASLNGLFPKSASSPTSNPTYGATKFGHQQPTGGAGAHQRCHGKGGGGTERRRARRARRRSSSSTASWLRERGKRLGGLPLEMQFWLAKAGQREGAFGQADGLDIWLASLLECVFHPKLPNFNLEWEIGRLLEMLELTLLEACHEALRPDLPKP